MILREVELALAVVHAGIDRPIKALTKNLVSKHLSVKCKLASNFR
jgi:hypothetical protein